MTGCDEERERIRRMLADRPQRVPVTQEWLKEQSAKQEAYARQRRAWTALQCPK